jgi:hypothetical protein
MLFGTRTQDVRCLLTFFPVALVLGGLLKEIIPL